MCEKCITEHERLDRRSVLKFALAAGVVFASAPQALAKGDKKPPKPENLLSPDSALERLMKGNDRYVEGVTKRYDFSRERKALSKGQTSPRF